jgi:segregation and condensation protein B
LLETLALIAYRQPITRSEIEEIRGVSVSSTIMRTLQERNWIRIVGHREVPGRPELLGTTREFIDYYGLRSLDELPTLAELRDIETIGVQLELPSNHRSEATPGDAAEGGAEGGAPTDETNATSTDDAADKGARPSIAEPPGEEPEENEASSADAPGDERSTLVARSDDSTEADPVLRAPSGDPDA